MTLDAVNTVEQQQVVARAIVAHAPAGWKRAWISARAGEGYVGELTADYIAADGTERWFDIADSDDVFRMSKALLTIRDAMRQDGQAPRSQCTFTLHPDGRSKLDVDYADRSGRARSAIVEAAAQKKTGDLFICSQRTDRRRDG